MFLWNLPVCANFSGQGLEETSVRHIRGFLCVACEIVLEEEWSTSRNLILVDALFLCTE